MEWGKWIKRRKGLEESQTSIDELAAKKQILNVGNLNANKSNP
jgi:hypothetical protein